MTRWHVDAAGQAHPPADPAARIVSLVPSLTELLFDLGLGAQVVGRTHYCIHPADRVGAVPSLGGTKKIRLDRLRALAPTHALVNVDETPRALAEAIADLGVRVVVTHPDSPLDNPPLYRLVGGLFGADAAAESLCHRFAAARRGVAGRNWPRRRVLYLIWRAPWMTVSPDTYVARTLALVGWQVAGDGHGPRYPEVTMEDALAAGLDLVLFATEPFRFAAADVAAFRAAHPHGPPARLIDGEMVCWYGSRAIAGLAYLARFAAGDDAPAAPSDGTAAQRLTGVITPST